MRALRRVWVFGILVALVLCVGTSAADLPAGSLCWSASRPLTWADFWATPPQWATPAIALASPLLNISWSATITPARTGSNWVSRVTALTVTNSVDCTRSWAIKASVTPEALHHEQLHFDLHEVYRRLLETVLLPMTAAGASQQASNTALNDLMTSTAASILQRAKAAQALYDAETGHGTNAAAQAHWEAKIAALLINPAAAP